MPREQSVSDEESDGESESAKDLSDARIVGEPKRHSSRYFDHATLRKRVAAWRQKPEADDEEEREEQEREWAVLQESFNDKTRSELQACDHFSRFCPPC